MAGLLGNILGSLIGSQYTMGELMNIDSTRQEKAGYCSVNLVKTFHELKEESVFDKFRSALLGKTQVKTYYVIFKLKVTSDSGKSYTVIIKTNPDFDLNKWSNNKVKIFCDCPDFKYRSAYLLNKRNSLFSNEKVKTLLGQSLSDAPKSKTKTTLLCKHSYAALQWLINNYSNIMKTI